MKALLVMATRDGAGRALAQALLMTLAIVLVLPLLDRLAPPSAPVPPLRLVETLPPPPLPPPPQMELTDAPPAALAPPLPRLDLPRPPATITPPLAVTLPAPAVSGAPRALDLPFSLVAVPSHEGLVFAIHEADQPPQPLARFAPLYPARARLRRVEGEVQVEFVVTAAGSVEDPVVVHAQPAGMFEEAALQAIRRWRFEPGLKDGQPVSIRVSQKLVFELEE